MAGCQSRETGVELHAEVPIASLGSWEAGKAEKLICICQESLKSSEKVWKLGKARTWKTCILDKKMWDWSDVAVFSTSRG